VSVFTLSAQRKVDALPPADRPHVVPAILRAFDTPSVSWRDPKRDEVEHRMRGGFAVIVNLDTNKIITFHKITDEPEVKAQPKRLTYRERHLAAQRKGGRR
jgi:hypothetical protein